MEKINLTARDIFDKSFNTDFKGYSANAVDSYLDLILEDYQAYDANIEELNDYIASLKEENEKLKQANLELEAKQKVVDLTNTTVYSSVDLLKRVSRLEEEVYKK